MSISSRFVMPRPFLKWVGGKGQLLDDLLARVKAAEPFGRYHEPFMGGGALFFELARQDLLGRKKAYLSDNNANLINTYLAVRDNVEEVIGLLLEHKARHGEDAALVLGDPGRTGEEYYYRVRSTVPESLPERAARIIYLNKTCFNGLFRENSKGGFNVPFGRYKNPMICDAENLRACAEALKKAMIEARPFETVLKHAEPGDLVYFDPPYVPLSETSSFTSYDKAGFGENDQRRLADVFAQLDGKSVRVLLSNSKTDLVDELYRDYTIEEVLATRSVNSRGDRRGKIAEALVRNF